MKHKIDTLEGRLLDAAVALALGHLVERAEYSTDWAHGGPIIERMQISVVAGEGLGGATIEWSAEVGAFSDYLDVSLPLGRVNAGSPTALMAAMREFVAWKFGDEVDLPDALSAQGRETR